jgi:hypothetical protein
MEQLKIPLFAARRAASWPNYFCSTIAPPPDEHPLARSNYRYLFLNNRMTSSILTNLMRRVNESA